MSSVVSALTGGGGSGVNFRADQANIINPVTQDQANEQYGNVQGGLQQQNAFLAALQQQNGVGNQSQVFNQLQGVANGTGPNPAQAMLNNATGQNVANQAALMAGQRGSGANVGLMSRQIANQGAQTQQNAAGQGAALQAQQSLGALNSMGQLATNQTNQQANALNSYNNAAQGAQSNVLNAIQGVNQARVGSTGSQNSANAAIQGQVAQGQMNLVGNVMQGVGSALMLAEGGQVGGVTPLAQSGPRSKAAQFFASMPAQDFIAIPKIDPLSQGGNTFGKGIGSQLKGLMPSGGGAGMPMAGGMNAQEMGAMPMMMAAEGGKVPAMVSPGERYLKPSDVKKVEEGGANPMEVGEKIPGKAKVKGAKNSYSNDTVSKSLDEGGIVLPRSVTQAKHPHWAAHAFVSAIMKEQALKGKK